MSVKIAISPWYMAAIVKKRKKLVIAELNLIWLLPWLNSALPATLKGLFALHSTALLKSGVNHTKLRYVNIQNQSQFALTLSLSLSLSLSLRLLSSHLYRSFLDRYTSMRKLLFYYSGLNNSCSRLCNCMCCLAIARFFVFFSRSQTVKFKRRW